jgi:hypothetical protein
MTYNRSVNHLWQAMSYLPTVEDKSSVDYIKQLEQDTVDYWSIWFCLWPCGSSSSNCYFQLPRSYVSLIHPQVPHL